MTKTREEAFLHLMETYGPALRRLAAAYVPGAHDREDLVQDIAAALWTALPGFRGEASERTWLYRVAHNTATRQRARLRQRGFREQELTDVAGSAPDHGLEQEQQRAWLLAQLQAMPPLDRQILTLHLEDLGNASIAEVAGLSKGAVATRLSRLRARLAETRQKEALRK